MVVFMTYTTPKILLNDMIEVEFVSSRIHLLSLIHPFQVGTYHNKDLCQMNMFPDSTFQEQCVSSIDYFLRNFNSEFR